MGEKEHKDYWSDCEQVFFHYDKGYGLTKTLRTISLGREDNIKIFFDTGELSNDINPMQRQVLIGIAEYRKGLFDKRSEANIKRRSAVGSRPAGTIKRRTANIKQVTTRKRITVH
ncbi:hypothetical protein ACFLTP_03435 [Chloroflexota bacterium]